MPALSALEEARARLERGAPPAETPRLATEPRSALEAVRAWLEARGAKRGHHVASNAALLLGFTAHARDAGWDLDSLTVRAMSQAMHALGYVAVCQGGVRGWRVDADTAAALKLLAPPAKARPQKQRRVRQPRTSGRPPFWPLPPRAQPLVDTLGRVWPSARVAAPLLPRVAHQDLQRAASKGTGAAGCLWRYLTPAEVATVPATACVGDVLPSLAWRGTVAVHAGQGLATGATLPTHPHQVSPTHPSMGPVAGGPTHIP